MRPITINGTPYPRRKAINWPFIHKVRAMRKESRFFSSRGFTQHEPDWEIVRGGKQDEVILEVAISSDGKSIWTKVGRPS